MAQPSVHGRFVWQELMTEDTAAAAAFYPKVVGWHTQPSSDPAYTMFAAGNGAVAGMMRLSDDAREMGARPHWLPYIGAEDVDKTLAAVARLGGKVLRPASNIENVGRFAVLADPQGAAFALYKPAQATTSAKNPPQPGEFSWQELATTDLEAAFDFYRELFGWQVMQRMDMGPAGAYLIFGWDGIARGGIYKLSPQSPAPYWLPYAEVPDADAAVVAAGAAGGKVAVGPMDVPGGGRIAQLLDRGGVLFAVHSAAKPAAAKKAVAAKKPAVAAKKTAAEPAASAKAGKPAAVAPAAKKAPAKTAPAKQAVAKKAAGKKAPMKKAAGKKAAGKKVATKKKVARRKKTLLRGKAAGKTLRRGAKKSVTAKKRSAKTARGGAGKARRKK